MTCKLCLSPNRNQIDGLLLSGTPLRDIAGQTGTTKSALGRHAVHVRALAFRAEQAIEGERRALARAEARRPFDVRRTLEASVAESLRLAKVAEDEGEIGSAAQHHANVGRLVTGMVAVVEATKDHPKGLLESFGSAREALAWLESEGLEMIRQEAAKEENKP